MQIKKLSALSLVFAFGLAACNDSTNPGEAFDPTASAADLAAVSDAFSTDVYASLAAMGAGFGSVAAAPALAAQVVDAGWLTASSPQQWELVGGEIAELFRSASAAVLLIPESFRGRTYEHGALEGWYHNPARAGAPANGIRFVLYEVDPITGVPGTTEVGWVDVMDESTATAAVVRLSVWSADVEYINYTVSATGLIGSIAFNIEGFVTDGTTRVDFSLRNSIDATFASVRVEVDYQINVLSRDFSISANVVIEFDAGTESGSITIAASFAQGANNVVIQGSFDSQTAGGSLEVLVNGSPFATITISGESISVAGPDGAELSAAHMEALRQIIDALGNVLDHTFEDLFGPVEWLFNFGAAL